MYIAVVRDEVPESASSFKWLMGKWIDRRKQLLKLVNLRDYQTGIQCSSILTNLECVKFFKIKSLEMLIQIIEKLNWFPVIKHIIPNSHFYNKY